MTRSFTVMPKNDTLHGPGR